MHGAATDQVQMQVTDGLPAFCTCVDHKPVPVIQPCVDR